MEVKIFTTATSYKKWVNESKATLDIHSVVVFNEFLVVTFKRK